MAQARARDNWYETNARGQHRAAGQERRLSGATTTSSSTRRSSSTIPIRAAIRAPFADHDHISGNSTDYGGVILDTRQRRPPRRAAARDRHAASSTTPSPTTTVQARIRRPTSSGSPAARINDHGWTLEIRVPFSSLRYRNADPQTWGILLYRNYPRDLRYQFFSASCRAAATASSAARTRWTDSSGLPFGRPRRCGAVRHGDARRDIRRGDPGTPLGQRSDRRRRSAPT